MKSIPQAIYYLIIIGIAIIAMNTYYFQNNAEILALEEKYDWHSKVGFVASFLISIASGFSFFLYKKYFPSYITFCYIGILIFVFIASFSDFEVLITSPNSFYDTKGIGTCFNLGLIFFAANTVYMEKILKLFYYLCFFFLIAAFINLAKVGFGASRGEFLYAILDFTLYLIWVFPFFFLQKEKGKKNLINLIAFLLLFFLILSISSRSYLIIYILYFIVKFKDQLQRKNTLLIIIGMAIIISGIFFLISNTDLNKPVETAFGNLSERVTEDSRSSQLEEFWKQYDFNNFFGVGPKATWFWSQVGPYSFLDNQFLLIAWWAGIPAFLLYFYYLARSFFYKNNLVKYKLIKGTQLIIGLWILACLGFAIYVSLSSQLYYYFITLLMGLHVCKFGEAKTEIEFEQT